MYRAIVLGLFVSSALADKDTMESACDKFGLNLTHCCNNMPESRQEEPKLEEMECYDKGNSSSDSPCVIEECLAKISGYYGSDGKLDKDGFAKYIRKWLKNDTDFFNVINEKCVNTDISKYGPPDMCDFSKIQICFYTFFVAEKCLEWNDEGECKGSKDIMQECKEA